MKTILSFLRQLNENNNRDWFAANKLMYEQAKNRFEEYVEILLPKIKQIDPKVDVMSAKECTFRIYRDARFSKDKTPFKNHFGAYLVGFRKIKRLLKIILVLTSFEAGKKAEMPVTICKYSPMIIHLWEAVYTRRNLQIY